MTGSRGLLLSMGGHGLALFVVLSIALTASARASDISVSDSGGAYTIRLTTLQELKFRTVIRQKYDFSCGSAALATLLSYHYGLPTKETAAFTDMWEHGDRSKIQKEGFSMLDMQQYLVRRGIRADGFRSTLERLVEANVPALVLLNLKGYMHFVIVEGVRGGRVLIADPSAGTRAMSVADFKQAWNGIFFVILDDVKTARASFNRDFDWAVQPQAPIGVAHATTDLGNLLLSLPARNVF
jgi:predicted double-glycine peptidase